MTTEDMKNTIERMAREINGLIAMVEQIPALKREIHNLQNEVEHMKWKTRSSI